MSLTIPANVGQLRLVPSNPGCWLPDEHLVRCFSEMVESELDVSAFVGSRFGSSKHGRPSYDPVMLLNIVLYGYMVGLHSSREIERACVERLDFRFLTGGLTPSFSTITKFRANHSSALAALFQQSVSIAVQEEFVAVKDVAFDGTKVLANASKHKAMSYERMCDKVQALHREIEELKSERRSARARRRLEIERELEFKRERLASIQEHKFALEDERLAQTGELPKAKDQRNFTDPDSRIMKQGSGFEQCYNAQAAVDKRSQIIIADGLKTAINADTNLQNIGVSATAVGPVVIIKSTSQNATTYDQSTSANATASIDLFVNQNSAEYLVIGGTKTTSDQISLVVYDADLSGGSKTVTYTVQAGDTLSTIASGLASAVSSDTDLQAIAVSASSSGTVVTIESNSVNSTTYRATTSSGATETALLGLPQNGLQTAVIGGTKTTSDTLTITVYDAGLSGGSKAVDDVVQSGDDLDAIAAGITTAINGDTDLQNINVSASSSSKVVFINSSSVNATSYTKSASGGATETITLAPSTSVTQFAYDNVNAITSISAGGAARVEGLSNKALKSAEVDSSAVSLNWSQAYSGNTSLSTGNNSVDVEVTDGANNTASASHQVLANSGSSASPTFDDNGNMTSDGTNTYEWDAENRLIKINYPGSQNYSRLVYDPRGRNVEILEYSSGSLTNKKQFVWLNSDRYEERNDSGAVVKQLFWLGETISGTKYFHTRDQIGSTRESTDSSGVIQGQYAYNPYGKVSLLNGSNLADIGYARYYNHLRSGLDLARMRSYQPAIARWLSRDPLPSPYAGNLFTFDLNEPVNSIDVLGLEPVSAGSGMGQLGMSCPILECMCMRCLTDAKDQKICKKEARRILVALSKVWARYHGANCDAVAGFYGDALSGLNLTMWNTSRETVRMFGWGNPWHQWQHIWIGPNPKPGCQFWVDNGFRDSWLIHFNGAPTPQGTNWYGIPFTDWIPWS
ncbi:MAG: transposase [Candidatus Obscuribacterales bacterium]